MCRSVGGMRASIYNAMPEEGVRKLVSFMKVMHCLLLLLDLLAHPGADCCCLRTGLCSLASVRRAGWRPGGSCRS